MEHNANSSYLEAQVMTATPQKLRLMLIDGAITAARQALRHWDSEELEAAGEAVIRCRHIVAELLAGIRPQDTDLARKVAGVYAFLFRLLTEAQLRRDREAVRKTIEILSVEQETWRIVCEKMPNTPLPEAGGGEPPAEITAADARRMLAEQQQADPVGQPGSRLELDA